MSQDMAKKQLATCVFEGSRRSSHVVSFGRASAASERAQRAKRAERREDLAIQLNFKRLLLTRILHAHEGSQRSPNDVSKHDGRSVS